MQSENLRVVISGGGTGGHIFPAISIANEIKKREPSAEILFIGAEGRMEMQRVPAAGYKIIGLTISGFDRKHLWKNIAVLYKLAKSQLKARRILRKMKPHIAIGVGGYASGPTLKMAGMMNIPTLIQEQNSYAGVTNKLLAQKARTICVAYDGMEKFFSKEKIVKTGNPIRQDLLEKKINRDEAIVSFGLNPDKKTILILGGSLGARTINESILNKLDEIRESGVQFIWQTGKFYFEQSKKEVEKAGNLPTLYVTDFINQMEYAYSAADLIISRAGAGSISEFSLLNKPVILVPSPNVAEDHQTKNAMALVDKNAALYIKDSEAKDKLITTAIHTVKDEKTLTSLSENIATLALPDSASKIVDEIMKLIKE